MKVRVDDVCGVFLVEARAPVQPARRGKGSIHGVVCHIGRILKIEDIDEPGDNVWLRAWSPVHPAARVVTVLVDRHRYVFKRYACDELPSLVQPRSHPGRILTHRAYVGKPDV